MGGGGGKGKGEGRVAKSYTIYRHLQTQMGQRRQDTCPLPPLQTEEARHDVLSLLSRQQWCYRKYVVEKGFKYAAPSEVVGGAVKVTTHAVFQYFHKHFRSFLCVCERESLPVKEGGRELASLPGFGA